ncbi:BTB/POZ domain-containing protein, partial [Schistosoma japonicum]
MYSQFVANESRIHEEMLSLLSVASRNLSDAELLEIAMRKANCVSGSASGALVSYTVPGTTSSSQHEPEEQDLDQSSTTTTGSLLSTSLPPARPATATGLLDNHGNPFSPEFSKFICGISSSRKALISAHYLLFGHILSDCR